MSIPVSRIPVPHAPMSPVAVPDLSARIARWERIGPRLIRADLENGRHRLIGGDLWVPVARKWLSVKEAERGVVLQEHIDAELSVQHFASDLKKAYRQITRRARHMVTRVRRSIHSRRPPQGEGDGVKPVAGSIKRFPSGGKR